MMPRTITPRTMSRMTPPSPTAHPSRPTLFLLFALCWVLLTAAGLRSDPTAAPEPEAGAWAPTTLALLHHNHRLCTMIAGDALAFWQHGQPAAGAAPTLEATEQSLRGIVSHLAEARTTADLIRRFMPRAKEEVDLETAASLERLAGMQSGLCDTVANMQDALTNSTLEGLKQRAQTVPLPSVERTAAYADEIGQREAQIEREENELGRLLVVPESDLSSALQPYLLPIQLAGVEAEGELGDQLDKLKPKEHVPTMAERMAAWHTVYSAEVRPAKQALGRYLTARNQNNAQGMGKACRELSETTVHALEKPRIFVAPDPKIDDSIRRAYVNLQLLAGYCTSGRFREVDVQLREAQEELAQAAEQLAPYGLLP